MSRYAMRLDIDKHFPITPLTFAEPTKQETTLTRLDKGIFLFTLKVKNYGHRVPCLDFMLFTFSQ